MDLSFDHHAFQLELLCLFTRDRKLLKVFRDGDFIGYHTRESVPERIKEKKRRSHQQNFREKESRALSLTKRDQRDWPPATSSLVSQTAC